MKKKKQILLVGLTPPPIHGQSIATGMLFEHDWGDIRVERLPIKYSKNLQEVGNVSYQKIVHMFTLVIKCLWKRYTTKCDILYYTPTSPKWVPILRDLFFLLLCRPFFKLTILHYHAGGLPEFLNQSTIMKWLGKQIYGKNAWCIALTDNVAVPDGEFGASEKFVIANGVDVPSDVLTHTKKETEVITFLFVGNLFRDKGILDAISVVSGVERDSDKVIKLAVIGEFTDPQLELEIRTYAAEANFEVDFLGVQTGKDKWNMFKSADIFIFPSYYSSENQPLVVFEAMAASLPVLATNWRGIDQQVIEGVTGFKVKPRDVSAMTKAANELVNNRELRLSMGQSSLNLYKQFYTPQSHIRKVREVFAKALEEVKSNAKNTKVKTKSILPD